MAGGRERTRRQRRRAPGEMLLLVVLLVRRHLPRLCALLALGRVMIVVTQDWNEWWLGRSHKGAGRRRSGRETASGAAPRARVDRRDDRRLFSLRARMGRTHTIIRLSRHAYTHARSELKPCHRAHRTLGIARGSSSLGDDDDAARPSVSVRQPAVGQTGRYQTRPDSVPQSPPRARGSWRRSSVVVPPPPSPSPLPPP